MRIHRFTGGIAQTNGYLLSLPGREEAVLIDAPEGIWEGIEAVLREEKLKLAELWLTHGHFDHILGGPELIRRTGAKVRAHPDDRLLIENPEVMKEFAGVEFRMEPLKVDAWLGQGEQLAAAGLAAEVRHVPGHCPGSVLFYFAAGGAAFVGDALFAGSIGRTDLPGGSFEVLERSIRTQIYTLPDETIVCAGHGPETTVGREKAGNPYVAE
ncbi:MAG TPA: MBL fold metallo-hydrolase [Opitutaceae bacterium]|jgi:glyoxylase-like metal-dependent hydrolase (beta-lactamase superfamily II)|nr:MBL fold metallo-hydrolase [Opitutaceae bacterium]